MGKGTLTEPLLCQWITTNLYLARAQFGLIMRYSNKLEGTLQTNLHYSINLQQSTWVINKLSFKNFSKWGFCKKTIWPQFRCKKFSSFKMSFSKCNFLLKCSRIQILELFHRIAAALTMINLRNQTERELSQEETPGVMKLLVPLIEGNLARTQMAKILRIVSCFKNKLMKIMSSFNCLPTN